MKFYNDGTVNFPYLSDGMWFLPSTSAGACSRKTGLHGGCKKVNQVEIYKQAATQTKTPIPRSHAHHQDDRRHGVGRKNPRPMPQGSRSRPDGRKENGMLPNKNRFATWPCSQG